MFLCLMYVAAAAQHVLIAEGALPVRKHGQRTYGCILANHAPPTFSLICIQL